MEQPTNQAPKNFFLQLGIIVTLYASAISFITFIFALIDKVYPDPLNNGFYYNDFNSGMRYSISVLIVMFPLYIWISRLYRKFEMENPEIRESKLRKWLLYFTLFIAGITIAGDLIVLINTFLGGKDVAISFFLKVLAVFIVSSAIFFFYLKDIKGYWYEHVKGAKIAAGVTSLIVLASVIGGIIVIGSPATQRQLSYDQTRAQDLMNIQWQIVSFYQAKSKIPETLAETTDPISGQIIPLDPETKTPYEYKKTGELSFELCATFSQNTPEEMSLTVPRDTYMDNWTHTAGRQCFIRNIDPDRYPPFKEPRLVR